MVPYHATEHLSQMVHMVEAVANKQYHGGGKNEKMPSTSERPSERLYHWG